MIGLKIKPETRKEHAEELFRNYTMFQLKQYRTNNSVTMYEQDVINQAIQLHRNNVRDRLDGEK